MISSKPKSRTKTKDPTKKFSDQFIVQQKSASADSGPVGERVQKIIALAGISSRRDAEDLIRDGLVTINGKVAKLGDKAIMGKDAIKVKGKLLHSSPNKVYYLIHKPKNVIAMVNEDEEGRPTLKDLVYKKIQERVFTVGRMDFTGEGAILLTNDGELAQKILRSEHIVRRYQVKVDRHPSPEDLARLSRGGRIESRSMHPFHVRVADHYTRNALIEISFEGMGTIDVRKFFENKGFHPERVVRVGIGHLSIEKMAPGEFKRLEGSSVKALLAQPELAKKQIDYLVEKKTSRAPKANDRDEKSTTKSSAVIIPRPKQSRQEDRAFKLARTGDPKKQNPRSNFSDRGPVKFVSKAFRDRD